MIAPGGVFVNGDSERVHTPVLVQAVLSSFAGENPTETLEGWIVDGTLGAAGHARHVLETFPGVRLFGIDQDPEILRVAERELAPFGERVVTRRARVSQLAELLHDEGIEGAVGFLLDLGASSLHFDRAERGFSFQADGPLDMRMDPDRERTAADIVNQWDEEDLADLFYYEGGEHGSRRVASAIVEARRRVPFLRTGALADVIARALGGGRAQRIHPATRTFQALRRAVNEEGEELIAGLEIAQESLADGGRLVVISFHSGEDAIVKRFLAERAREGIWLPVSKKAIGPETTERRANPRARSARLRCGVRLREAMPVRREGLS